MLTMTPDAETILADRRAERGAPDTYGVRFFTKQAEDAGRTHLAFNFVASPRPNDTVIDEGDLRAFVAPEVEEAIGDIVVDVEQKPGGPGLVVKRVRSED